jgi:hypothetical protein
MNICRVYASIEDELMKGEIQKMKRILTGFVLIGCLLVLGACNGSGSEQEAKDEEKVIATVNGKEIFQSEFDLLLLDTTTTYAQQGMDVESLDDEMKEQMETQVLDQLINTELLLQQAESEDIKAEEASVNERYDEMKAQFEDEKQFEEALVKNKLTVDSLKERIESELQITTYLENNVGEPSVTEDEVSAIYEQYKEAMTSQEQEVQKLEDIKVQLEQEVIMQKRQEKISEIIEKLRNDNEVKILS